MIVNKMGKIFYVFDLLLALVDSDVFLELFYKRDINLLKKSHFVYLSGKPRIPHLLRYQGLAVDDCGFALDALNLGHHSQRQASLDFRSFRVLP